LTQCPTPPREPNALSPKAATKLQKAYAARRRAWAKAVGRPYERDSDPRPPPGELDVGPDE
ncbi:hypothetical protein, partial [Phenylobacterium sp.]|uniref:hypothetical protein n=1 Tax=Phenylobacterium sp. TaxID=1871053 RepID=UPI00374D47AA